MNNKNKRTNQKGFTLIELMIVVAIIGALSAIAIPAYKNYVAKSEVAAAVATMKALLTPAELIYQEDGKLASGTSVSELGISASSNVLGTISVSGENTLKFLFGANSSVSSAYLSYSRTDTGWTCAAASAGVSNLPTIDSCS
ncbi:pilin [Vibrio sp. 10N.222.52.C3]|uniref:pilin n=1 Tax=Vibrio sp. 10N.222.52.C3 TaxID=3229631 RepID=UPI00354C7B97